MNTPLHCLLLQTLGELLEDEEDFLRLGYAVEAFPSTQDASCLDDAEPEELLLHAYAPGWCHSDLPVIRPAVLLWAGCLPIPAGRRTISSSLEKVTPCRW